MAATAAIKLEFPEEYTLEEVSNEKIKKKLDYFTEKGIEKISEFIGLASIESMFYLYLLKKYKSPCFLIGSTGNFWEILGVNLYIREFYSQEETAQSYSGCLGQLATIDFPTETSPDYMAMMTKAIFSFDQFIWWTLIKNNLYRNGWNSGYLLPPIVQASDIPKGDVGANNYSSNYMVLNPAHLNIWYYCAQTDKKGRDTSYYVFYDYSLGWPPTHGNDNPISNDAAKYLFIDTIPGTVMNPDGLFNRYYVFYNFGLEQNGY